MCSYLFILFIFVSYHGKTISVFSGAAFTCSVSCPQLIVKSAASHSPESRDSFATLPITFSFPHKQWIMLLLLFCWILINFSQLSSRGRSVCPTWCNIHPDFSFLSFGLFFVFLSALPTVLPSNYTGRIQLKCVTFSAWRRNIRVYQPKLIPLAKTWNQSHLS